MKNIKYIKDKIGTKKLIIPLLIVAFAIQWCAPVYAIAHKYNILRTGEEFKFSVRPIDPVDAFRGRYVSLNSPMGFSENGKYGALAVGEDGYAYVSEVMDDKPKSGPYVKNSGKYWFRLPIDRYYMEENLAPRAEALMRRSRFNGEAYVTVRVKNGELVISGLYVDGVAIEDILRGE